MVTVRSIVGVGLGFAAALVVNLSLLPGDHIVSSLYLIPVLAACHRWRPRPVAVAAVVAALLYLVSAWIERRPPTVWPFGVLAFVIGGYLTARFARQREEIERQARREVEDRRRLQMFIGMVAHDLAGSLTNVAAGTELLSQVADHESSEAQLAALTAIDGGTHQIHRLLADLRDAAAIGTGQFTVVPAAMDLVALVREVVDQQRLAHPEHRIALEAPDRILGSWDRERLGQLLTNLISNAC